MSSYLNDVLSKMKRFLAQAQGNKAIVFDVSQPELETMVNRLDTQQALIQDTQRLMGECTDPESRAADGGCALAKRLEAFINEVDCKYTGTELAHACVVCQHNRFMRRVDETKKAFGAV